MFVTLRVEAIIFSETLMPSYKATYCHMVSVIRDWVWIGNWIYWTLTLVSH
jgi:hypothetical protein